MQGGAVAAGADLIDPVDRGSAIAAASLLIALNQLVINVQPLLIGALARHRGLDDGELGLVSSALVGGALLASSTAPFWVRRVNWRRTTTLALLLAALMFWVTSLVTGFGWLCLAFALAGLMKGMIGAPSFVCLGDTSRPERNFGTSVAVQAIVAAAAAVPMAGYLIPAYGLSGVLYSLIAAMAVGLVAVRFLPASGRGSEQAHGARVKVPAWRLLPFIAVLLAMMLFTIGVTSFWFFLERIGTAQSIPAATIGLAVSGTALVSIPGSFAVTWLSRWLGGLQFIVLGSLLIVAGFALVAVPEPVAFMAGSLIFAIGWGIAQPGYWALAREADPTSRLFVLSSAVAGLASVITGLIAGPMIGLNGYTGLIVMSGLFVAAGIALCVLIKPIAARMPPMAD
jgi:MFS family permease